MVLGFDKYLNETIGADSMERDPADLVLHPDIQRSSALMFNAGTSGTIPTQWNNSPFLSGGRLTSAFGLNPKQKKKKVLSYHEFVKSSKKFSK